MFHDIQNIRNFRNFLDILSIAIGSTPDQIDLYSL